MIKYICKKFPDNLTSEDISNRIAWGFLRNFGGLMTTWNYLGN